MDIKSSILFGLIFGLIAFNLLYLGKGIQKYAIEGLKEEQSVKNKHSGIWIFGTFLTFIFMIVHWLALLLAPINLIAPLEGVGLILLFIFSHFVLKEKVTRIEILGVMLIIIGTIFITLFNPNKGNIQKKDLNLITLFFFSIIILIVEGILIIISKLNDYKYAGFTIGFTAGTLMAIQTVSKRITAIPDVDLTFLFIFIVLAIILAFFTLLFTQYAFTKAKANIVVPCFTSASISLAIIIGIIALNEKIALIQVIGIIIIICGIIFLTAFKKENNEKNNF